MKNKNGKAPSGMVLLIVAALVIAYVAVPSVNTTVNGIFAPKVAPVVAPVGGAGTDNVAPSVSLIFTNALTKQSITAIADNYKDANTGNLLGKAYTFVNGAKVIPIVNASGYIRTVQPTYNVVNGPQNIQGQLYQFGNQTIQIYNNAKTGLVGGFLGVTGNDSVFTTQANNKIILTGNTFKSSGRLFVVYEVSNTTSVASATLTKTGDASAIPSKPVPNCYTNNLTGTPYKVGWELPAIVGGSQVEYNLQTTSASGKAVSGQATLVIYNERDGIDSLTGEYLTSGICDSNNVFYNQDVQPNNHWYFQ